MAQTRPFLWTLAGVGVALCFWIAWPFLGDILTAATLAAALAPLQTRIRKRFPSRSASSLLTLLLFITAVVVPATFTAILVSGEIRQILTAAPTDFAWLDPYVGRFGITGAEIRTRLESLVLTNGRTVLQTAANIAVGIGGGIVSVFLTLFALYYFLRDGHVWLRGIGRWAPLEAAQKLRLADVATQTIHANVYGVFAVAIAQGLLALIGFWFAGVPSPVLWAVVTAFFSLIPILGSGVVWVPAVGYLLAKGQNGAAVFLLAWSAGLVAWADNIVRPYVISGAVQINPVLILFSLLGGAQAFGVIGLFVGPVVVALTGAVFQILQEQQKSD
jgi:predicted PurR-regulated permease PerM